MITIPKQLHTLAYVADTKALDLDSEEFSQICERSLTWRGKDSQSRTWLLRWKRENWMQHLCSRTLKPSHTDSFVDSWISSLEASRANRSVLQESVTALTTPDTSSHTYEKESESADLDLFSWRTSKESSPAEQKMENQFSSMSSESWKVWVTKQRREYSQRVKSAHLTKESGSSSWATPTCHLSKENGYPAEYTRNTPTLTAQANHPAIVGHPNRAKISKSGKSQESLATKDLTPKTEATRKLNPNWVEQLMGLPVGWTDLDSWATE